MCTTFRRSVCRRSDRRCHERAAVDEYLGEPASAPTGFEDEHVVEVGPQLGTATPRRSLGQQVLRT